MRAKTEVIIGYGLPASGKTTFLQSLYSNSMYLDIDLLAQNAQKERQSLHDYLNNHVSINRSIEIIVDGLFTTNKDLIEIINIIKSLSKNELNFTIYYWNEDRQSCIWNDTNRRKESSVESIKNLKYETPNANLIKEKTEQKINLIAKNVIRKSDFEIDLNKIGYKVSDEKFLYSDSWSIGGIVCNCWGDSYTVSEEEPVKFIQLDKLLEEKKPQLTFLQYKTIFEETVSTDVYSEGDYYGGSINYMRYKCNLEKLYKCLKEM